MSDKPQEKIEGNVEQPNLPPKWKASQWADADGCPPEEVIARIPELADQEQPEVFENAICCAFLDRLLRALYGSQREMLDEALVVSTALSGEVGKKIRERWPTYYAQLTILDDILAEAGRRSNPAAVPGRLRFLITMYPHLIDMLRALIEKDRTMKVLERQFIPSGSWKHLMYNLEKMNLVQRFQKRKNGAIWVCLLPLGRRIMTDPLDFILNPIREGEDFL